MTPEIWLEVEDLYHKALQVRTEERAAFLNRHCAKNEFLRKEVEHLLRDYDRAGSFLETPSMALRVGQQLGSYEITSLLGKGGMGEVYRAHDAKLKRDVAIKILPDEFSRDPERVIRFQREAEMLAALNHQNIAAIYDLQESCKTRFLILEYVEGDTLRDILKKRGALPVDESLAIAKQICEALETAHEKGIVHRDLKPANVKVMPDGKVKVLDFGLAKVIENAPSNSAISKEATNTGAILGTAAYMSPEQAKGETVDRRADIFGFGCVLYEMLAGRPAFEGNNTAEILGRVVAVEPDWTRLPRGTPVSIQKLLRRVLKKDPRQRLGDIRDARIEIEEAEVEREQPVVLAPTRNSRLTWTAFVIAVLAAAGLAIPTLSHWRETAPPSPPEMRVDIVTPATSDPASFAVSPDGRKLVFVAAGDGPARLWLRPLDMPAAQPLAGTDGATQPFWSPDSRSVGFFAGGKLMRLDVGGGLPQTLVSASNPSGWGGSWSPEGLILFTSTKEILRIPASGGETVPVTRGDASPGAAYISPQFLPGGRQFIFTATGGGAITAVYLGSLDAPEIKRLTSADSEGLYAPPGWLLFVHQGQLVARRFDLHRGELTGDPITVADQVASDPPSRFAFSVSASGVVAYRAAERTQLTWFDRTGRALGAVGDPDENNLGYPELSPDQRRVAVDRTVRDNQDIWLIDLMRGGITRFTFGASNERRPLWSPDGMQIAFDSNRKQTFDIYTKPSTGAGMEQLLLESPYSKVPDDWSPDGRFVLYNENNGKTSDIWAVPVRGDRKPIPVATSPFTEQNGQFSPDGRWVAYQSNESGRFEIYVVPFPPGASKWQVSTGGGIFPRWRHDGKELFFIALDEKMMAATVSASGTSFHAAPPVTLFQTRVVGGRTTVAKQQYAVSSDGRFLINVPATDSASVPITLILNWHPPAK